MTASPSDSRGDDAAGIGDPAVSTALAALSPSADSLLELAARLRRAMALGLAGGASPLKMLATFVEQPHGDERGEAVVVDWGGTHGRVVLVELAGAGVCRGLAEEHVSFGESAKAGPVEHVLDVIAAAVARIVGRGAASVRQPMALGFVYSYPARQSRIDRAVALALTKGWRVSGLVGQEVSGLLEAALARRGLASMKVAAIANDTVAALILGSYQARGGDPAAPSADVGLIVGTGTNQAVDLAGAGVRNLESGNFDDLRGVATAWDDALDRELADPAPGAQRFEKMAAGHYLGEILRRVVLDLRQRTSLFQWGPGPLDVPFQIDGVHLSRLAADDTPDLAVGGALLSSLRISSTLAERHALAHLSRAVSRRSARMIAAGLLGALTFTDRGLDREHLVAVDGSLYGEHPGYAAMVRAGLSELAGPERAARICVAYVKDSTAAGAAVIAAVAARRSLSA